MPYCLNAMLDSPLIIRTFPDPPRACITLHFGTRGTGDFGEARYETEGAAAVPRMAGLLILYGLAPPEKETDVHPMGEPVAFRRTLAEIARDDAA